MQSKFVIDGSTKKDFAGRTLLFDTNALIDAYRLPVEFFELLQEFELLECDVATTKSITIEFLGGTTDSDDMDKKIAFLEIIFGKKLSGDNFYLPLARDFPDKDDFLTFSRAANRFSPTDFELFRTMKKYQHSLVLISRNHKDFSTKLADRISFITLLGKSEIHTYGVYRAK